MVPTVAAINANVTVNAVNISIVDVNIVIIVVLRMNDHVFNVWRGDELDPIKMLISYSM